MINVGLGLDTKAFEAELKRASKLMESMGRQIENGGKAFSLGADKNSTSQLDIAKQKTENLTGSLKKMNQTATDSMRALQTYAENLNLKYKSGQNTLVKTFNQWSEIKSKVEGTSMSFERLYSLQQQYQKLSGQKYSIKSQADMQALPAKVAELNELKKYNAEMDKLAQKKKDLTNIALDLGKKLATIFSLGAIKNFVVSIIEIGGELEKQRVALGSIVQDISRANILFSQLKVQALESPFSFKQVVAGTRQLAAFNIEYEKLYDTQFMLSELSAGLGVDMGRLVLAYGQVKSAAVLRGQELRQFTEAGIPIIDALAKKFTELEGTVVSTGEVFDKVSQRLVPFKMVDEILRDMTEEGGKFFEMQAKQAETIAGQWNNVRDAVDLMFLSIANKEEGFLMGTIKAMRSLISNWEILKNAMTVAGYAYVAYLVISIVGRTTEIKLLQKYNKLLITRAALEKAAHVAGVGAVAAAVVGIALLIGWWMKASSALSNYKKSLEEIAERHTDDFESEKDRLKALTTELEKAVVGSENYKKVKDKIISQYGQYMPFLLDENGQIKDMAASYEDATRAMKIHFAQKALEEAKAKMNEDPHVKKLKQSIRGQLTFDKKEVSGYTQTAIYNEVIKYIDDTILSGGDLDGLVKKMGEIAENHNVKLGEALARKHKSENSAINLEKVLGWKEEELLQWATTPIRTFTNKYYSYITERTAIMGDVMVDQFQGVQEGVVNNLKKFDKVFEEHRKKLENTEGIDPLSLSLKVEKSKVDQEVSSAVAVYSDIIVKAMKDKGKSVVVDATTLFSPEGGLINRASFVATFNTLGAVSANALYDGLLKEVKDKEDSMSTNFQKTVLNFFTSRAAAINNDITLTEEQKKASFDMMEQLRGQVAEYKSLSDAQDVFARRDALEITIAQQKSYMDALTNTKNAYSLLSKEYLAANPIIAALNLEIGKNILLLGGDNDYIKSLGLIKSETAKTPAGGATKNEEPARLKRVASMYKEINENYEKYIKYLDEDTSKQFIRNEFAEQYAELNKEMGGKLPVFSVIETQEDLVKAVQALGGFAKTPKGKTAIQTFLNSILGGQKYEGAKKAVEDAIKDIKMEVEKAKGNWSLGQEIMGLEQETGATGLKSMFKGATYEFDAFIKELQAKVVAYRNQGVTGEDDAKALEKDIADYLVNRTKTFVIEAAKITFGMLNDKDKAKVLLNSIKTTTEEITALKEKIALLNAETDADKLVAMNAELGFLEATLLKTQKTTDELNSSLFRSSELYQDLFGDIAKYGEATQKYILKDIRERLALAKENATTGADGKDQYIVRYLDEEGKIESITLDVKEYGRAVAQAEKQERKLKEGNVWGKIAENFKKYKQTKGTPSGEYDEMNEEIISYTTIKNVKELGEGITGIGQQLGGLKTFGEALGLDESLMTTINGVVDGIEGIGKLMSNPDDVGAALQIIGAINAMSDNRFNAAIRRNEVAIEALAEAFTRLEKAMTNAAGFKEFSAAYDAMVGNLIDKQKRLADSIRQELSKLHPNFKKVAEYTKEYTDALQEIKDKSEEIITSMSTDLGSAAQSFADGWVEAMLAGEDAMDSFEDSYNEMVKNILKKQIATGIISETINPLIKSIRKAVDPKGDGNVAITEQEWAVVAQTKSSVFTTLEALQEPMKAILDMFGLTGGDAFKGDSLQKGIQGITESSAQVIASYMNSVRLEVITIRTLMERQADAGTSAGKSNANSVGSLTEVNDTMLHFYPSFLENLIDIKNYTRRLDEAYDPSIRGFRMA